MARPPRSRGTRPPGTSTSSSPQSIPDDVATHVPSDRCVAAGRAVGQEHGPLRAVDRGGVRQRLAAGEAIWLSVKLRECDQTGSGSETWFRSRSKAAPPVQMSTAPVTSSVKLEKDRLCLARPNWSHARTDPFSSAWGDGDHGVIAILTFG
ncbi:hypothetical protein ACTIVE_1811 [Actinomadura verrucosospora]|uniref:Uncharacterized protein n=1 Tax=Actinomadura verrucosospora TaxID=46165 RepID=A0A7D3VT18_ACTVE|nr:hypothetical protein ACTIVE_1811 [Actinomadura verrucosospora]